MSPSAHIASVFRVESVVYDCLLEASLDPSSPFNDGEVSSALERICDALGINWERLTSEAADEAAAESLGSEDSSSEEMTDEEGDRVIYVRDPDDFATSESSSEEEETEDEDSDA
eukprot:tig00021137_g19015.t1